MSKELTPLEALKNLTEYLTGNYRDWFKELSIIETALKEYELMKQTKIIVVDKDISDEDLEKLKNQRMLVDNLGQCEIKPLFDEETQKKLKALEIIKEKNVNIFYLKNANSVEEYNTGLDLPKVWQLTQEEYDILKEVML